MRTGRTILVFFALTRLVCAQDVPVITQAELVRRTQLLYDAVAPGDKAPWQKYLADDVLVHDEKGDSYTKPTFLGTLDPMPPGYSGSIRVTHPQAIFATGVAIFSYDTDEVETVFGNRMTARYHQTDTWLYRNHLWQIAASQVMRYYEDPAAVTLSAAQLAGYAGTYELAPGQRILVSVHDGKLFAQRNTGKPAEMLAEAPDLFFRPGVEGRRLFRRDGAGKVVAMVDRRNNEDMLWRRVR